MKKYQKISIVFIGITAITAPVILAIYLSFKQSFNEKTIEILRYAQDILHRSENTAEQVRSGIDKLSALSGRPCDKKNIDMMRAIDLNSTYIQAFGFVDNNEILCSSIGKNIEWKLGTIDEVTPSGVILRLNVKAPFVSDISFLGIQKDNYIAIVHKKLPLDTTLFESNISLGIFTLDKHKILMSQGMIKEDWIHLLSNQQMSTFFKDGYIVAIVRSKIFNTGAIAAEHFSYFNQQTRNTAFILIPIGLLAGIILAFAIMYWARQLISLPAEIKAGLKRNEFFLMYQPIIEVETGCCIGAEALIRWKRPNGEIITPDLFIPIAEYAKFIDKITQRLFNLIAQDVNDTDIFNLYPNFHVAINVSSSDLHSANIISLLHKLCIDTKTRSKNFIIEATESVFLKKEIARKIINDIQNLGVRIALDDFGTGYSSLSYLGTFKLDYLKIDKSFINAIGTDAPINQVILHIIDIANELKIQLIAEGIETKIQANFIREHGVQYAQGYLYGKPMPLNEIINGQYKIS